MVQTVQAKVTGDTTNVPWKYHHDSHGGADESDRPADRLTDYYFEVGARLLGAQLGGADLTGARLHGCDLRGANLAHARLGTTQFHTCNLRQASFAGPADGVRLVECHLGAARLEGIRGQGWLFKGINLSGAALRDVAITGVELDQVNLRRAQVDRLDLEGKQARRVVASASAWGSVRWRIALTDELDLTDSRVGALRFERAVVNRLVLSGAEVDELHGTEAALLRTQWTSARIARWAWRGCAMSELDLRSCQIGHADWRETELLQVTAGETAIARLELTGAKLLHGAFRHCDTALGSEQGFSLWGRVRIDASPALAALAGRAARNGAEVTVDGRTA